LTQNAHGLDEPRQRSFDLPPAADHSEDREA